MHACFRGILGGVLRGCPEGFQGGRGDEGVWGGLKEGSEGGPGERQGLLDERGPEGGVLGGLVVEGLEGLEGLWAGLELAGGGETGGIDCSGYRGGSLELILNPQGGLLSPVDPWAVGALSDTV